MEKERLHQGGRFGRWVSRLTCAGRDRQTAGREEGVGATWPTVRQRVVIGRSIEKKKGKNSIAFGEARTLATAEKVHDATSLLPPAPCTPGSIGASC